MKPYIALIFGLLLPFATQAAGPVPLIALTVHSKASGDHRFSLEYASTDAEKERGLMYRLQLRDDGGMLFAYQPPQTAYMWMKNTYIPLDMLFVDAKGAITYLARDAEPFDETPIGTATPTAAVIELQDGTIDHYHLQLGDQVQYALPKAAK